MKNLNKASEALVTLLDELNDVIAEEKERVRKYAIDNNSTFLEVLQSELYTETEKKIKKAEGIKTDILKIHGRILDLA